MAILKSIISYILAFIKGIFSFVFGWFRGKATTAAKVEATVAAMPSKSKGAAAVAPVATGAMAGAKAVGGWFYQGIKQCVDHPLTFVIVASAFAGGWFVGFDMASRSAAQLANELAMAKRDAQVSNKAARALTERLATVSAAKPQPLLAAPAPIVIAPVEPPKAPETAPVLKPPAAPIVAPAPAPAKKSHHKKEATSSTWDPATWHWSKYWETTKNQ